MLFNSFAFVLFYILVCVLYFSMQPRHRWILLFVVSYWFYMSWRAEYALLMLATTIVDFYIALAMGTAKSLSVRRWLLAVSLVSNLGVLFAFKYWDFFGDSFAWLSQAVALDIRLPALNVLLPVGISFYTFQSMSYTIDVYRNETPPERHLGIFAVYVAFFPQLVAGPIERSSHLLPQFHGARTITYQGVRSGLQLMLWGALKKILIADAISVVVETVYRDPTQYSGPFLILATLFFAVQIYCDFSGYSDIAIGSARIMGYNLMTNFRRPYFAASMSDFWHRWHISLSTWFRDYVYMPLGGSRVTTTRQYLNIMAVFVLSGLWHGAAWNFVIWGCLHGLFLVGERMWNRLPLAPIFAGKGETGFARACQRAMQSVFVCVLVLIGWVFFRANSIPDALYVLGHTFDWTEARLSTLWRLGLPRFEMVVAIGSIGVLFLVDYAMETNPSWLQRLWSRTSIRWTIYQLAIFAIACLGTFGRIEFIYFQF